MASAGTSAVPLVVLTWRTAGLSTLSQRRQAHPTELSVHRDDGPLSGPVDGGSGGGRRTHTRNGLGASQGEASLHSPWDWSLPPPAS